MKKTMLIVFMGACFALVLVGCNQEAPGSAVMGQNEHPERDVTGAILMKNGDDILEIENGVVWGTVQVAKEAHDVFELVPIDAEGNAVEGLSDECAMCWSCNDGCIKVDKCDSALEKFQFHIHGISAGKQDFGLQMYHENPGETILDLPKITVSVVD